MPSPRRQQLSFYEKRLRRLCRKLSRQVEGSASRAKTVRKIQKTYEKIIAESASGVSLSEFNKRMFLRAEQLGVKLRTIPLYACGELPNEATSDESSSECDVCNIEIDQDVKAATKLIKFS